MEKHINLVATFQIGLSIFNLLFVVIFYTIAKVIGGFIDDANGSAILSTIATIITIFLVIISIPGILAGLGLLKRKEWARILTMILSVIELFSFPVGTAIGIYSLWALNQPESIAAFKTSTFQTPEK